MKIKYYRSENTFFKQIGEKIWSISFGQTEWGSVPSIHHNTTKKLFTKYTEIDKTFLPLKIEEMDSKHNIYLEEKEIDDFIDLCEKESTLNTVITEYAGYDYIAPAVDKMMEGNNLLIELLKKKKKELGLEQTYGEI
jgi:hypothetical protein